LDTETMECGSADPQSRCPSEYLLAERI